MRRPHQPGLLRLGLTMGLCDALINNTRPSDHEEVRVRTGPASGDAMLRGFGADADISWSPGLLLFYGRTE